MSPIDRVADWCVARAARRWPRDLSEAVCREWRAELAALRTEPGLGPVARSRRAIAFAASLACSPAVEAEDAVIPTRRERLAGVGRAPTALGGAAGVTLLAAALFNGVHDAYHGLSGFVSPPVGIAVDATLVAAAVATMSWIGVLAARRGRWPAATRSAARSVASAARYTVPLGLAVYAFLLYGNEVEVMPFMGWIDIAPAVAVWTVLTALTLGLASRVTASGHRRLGLSTATVGSVAALVSATACGSLHAAATLKIGFGSAPAWFPLALLPGGTAGFGRLPAGGVAAFGGHGRPGAAAHASDILLGNASAMVGPLLLCSAFVVAYAMRAARGAAVPAAGGAAVPAGGVAVPAGGTALPPPATADVPWRGRGPVRTTAAAAGAGGLAIWAYLAGMAGGPGPASLVGHGGVLRMAAITLIVSGLAVVLAGGGPVVTPSAGAFVVLVAADHIAGRAAWHGVAAAAALAALGATTVYAGWLLSGELAGPGTTVAAARRCLVGVAVLSALAVPAGEGLPRPAPGGVVAIGGLLAGLTWLLAVTAAIASRRTPLGRPAVLAAAGLPLVPLVAATTWPGAAIHAPDQARMSLLIRVLLAVLALSVARWDGSARRVRQGAAWLVSALAAAVLSLPVSDALRLPDEMVGTTVARIARNSAVFGFGFAATAAGQLALAVLLGALAAGWVVAPEPATAPGQVPPDRAASGPAGA